MMRSFRYLSAIALVMVLSCGSSQAQTQGEAQLPPGFTSAAAAVNGATLHYVVAAKAHRSF
jgi:hypothetical protein